MIGRRWRRRRKLLDDLKERRGYSHLKEEAVDRTMWRAGFGRSFGPVVRQTTKWMNDLEQNFISIWYFRNGRLCVHPCIRCNNTFSANHSILTNQGLTHTDVNIERLIINHSPSRNFKKQFNISYTIWCERGWNFTPADSLNVQLIKGEDRNSNCGNQSLLIMTGWNVAETRWNLHFCGSNNTNIMPLENSTGSLLHILEHLSPLFSAILLAYLLCYSTTPQFSHTLPFSLYLLQTNVRFTSKLKDQTEG